MKFFALRRQSDSQQQSVTLWTPWISLTLSFAKKYKPTVDHLETIGWHWISEEESTWFAKRFRAVETEEEPDPLNLNYLKRQCLTKRQICAEIAKQQATRNFIRRLMENGSDCLSQ